MSLLSEIGGEFWRDEGLLNSSNYTLEDIPFVGERRHVLSGRTALNMIVEDMLAQMGSFSIGFPSYFCHTMLEPFARHGISIHFYPVIYDGKLRCDLEQAVKNDVVYLMEYFGFADPQVALFAAQCKKRHQIVLCDQTHSAFLPRGCLERFADYTFASYRKWLYVNCAVAEKSAGFFLPPPYERIFTHYLDLRNEAMRAKSDYIRRGIGSKDYFLALYREAEMELNTDSCGYVAETASVETLRRLDHAALIRKRRENARILIERISQMPRHLLEPIFDTLSEGDCPLFVPVIVSANKRDSLLRALIQDRIYCPHHWPLSVLHPYAVIGDLYARELSIVCDQRYDMRDMMRIADSITKWCEQNA